MHDSSATTTIKVVQTNNDLTDRKVIFVPSKNIPIQWLTDWLDFHVQQGFNAVLFYDNNTDTYPLAELESKLNRSDILIKFLNWSQRGGPMGGHVPGMPDTFLLPWDSDFNGYVMLEHAKWRYLTNAALVANVHTDELFMVNGSTLDEFAQDNQYPSAWIVDGKWIEPVDSLTGTSIVGVPFEDRKFENYFHTDESKGSGSANGIKWILNPRTNLQYQWHMHTVYGPRAYTDSVKFAHIAAMNVGLERKRDEFTGNPNKLVPWYDYKKVLDKWKNNNG
jgi:hypothetical protein